MPVHVCRYFQPSHTSIIGFAALDLSPSPPSPLEDAVWKQINMYMYVNALACAAIERCSCEAGDGGRIYRPHERLQALASVCGCECIDIVCVCLCVCQHRPILLIFRISIARRPSVPELGILYTGSCIIKIHRTHFAIDGVNARRMHCRVSMYVCVCVRRWRTRLGIVGKIQPTHQTNTQANITCLPYITCGANTVCVRWYDYT